MISYLNKLNGKLIRKWHIALLVPLICSAGLKSYSQEIEITASIDSSAILIGDQTTVRLEIRYPDGSKVITDTYADTLTKGVEILLQSEFDTTHFEENRILLRKEFLITCFDSGIYVIPPFEVSLPDTAVDAIFRSKPLFLRVMRADIQPADSSEQFFDIKLPYEARVGFRELMPYILGGLFIAGLATFLILFLKKRKRDEPVVRKLKPSEPAHIAALRELDKLKSEKIWQQGKVKLYYSRLTEILRNYLEDRYGILAMEQTSSETLHSLLEIGFNDNNLYSKLKEVLYLADLAKFAKAKPLPNENETSLLSAYIFVNETKEAWKKIGDDEKGTDKLEEKPAEDNEGSES